MTYGEILNAIKSYNHKYEREQKEKVILAYKIADLISTGLASVFSEDVKFPQIYDAFPGMFEKEKATKQKAEQEKAMQLYKAKFRSIAESHNARWGEHNK